MLTRPMPILWPRQPQLLHVLGCAAGIQTTASDAVARRGLATARVMVALHARHCGPVPRRECPWSLPNQRAFSTTRWRRLPASTVSSTSSSSPSSPSPPPLPAADLPDLDKVVALVQGARDRLLSHPSIPPEAETAATLQVCAEAADLIMDASVQPQLSSIDHQADTAASSLLLLDGKRSRRGPAAAATPSAMGTATETVTAATGPAAPPRRLRQAIDQISDAAFAVVDEPRVFVTPQLLAQYVNIQARLGRPESLPHVLHQYAAKAAPAVQGGSDAASASTIVYRPQNPARAAHAVDPAVGEVALDAALAAQNLDAAVGVVEHTFAAPAYRRAKLLRKGVLPAFVVVGVPLATYSLAERLAAVQQTMEPGTATGLAFAAILAYIGFTGTIGVVANATANDQMRRVTWAPGTPLRERWLREEERAALDTVACAFGFSEAHRYGEEEGTEFQALREYLLRKGMLLDQVELMEGMSS